MATQSIEEIADATKIYSKERNKFVTFSDVVKRILEEALSAKGIRFQSVDSRAKSLDSFDSKCKKQMADGTLRYSDPMTEITDLTGARIVTFTLGDVQDVCKFLESHFVVKEKKDLGEERLEDGKFGYQSIHYLCQLSTQRVELPDFTKFSGLVCEIQVRTVLQHVWAQIEHGVQYKDGVQYRASAALPLSIKRKFMSLAGLLEIGDREFQAIEEEFDRLKVSVKTEFEDDLTKEAFENKPAFESTSLAFMPSQTMELLDVRGLVAEGRYSEAINVYDRKISDQPRSLTLYLGRAKAKFLSGDIEGAAGDLNFAEGLQPGNFAVAALKDRIIEGNYNKDRGTTDTSYANDLTNFGHTAMKDGDGELAYLRYSEAQENGASRPFSTLNRAMACILAGDYVGASNIADSLQLRSGTPMEINILALKAISATLSESLPQKEALVALQAIVSAKGDFSFSLSPLAILKVGLEKKLSGDELAAVLEVFQVLEPL